jgi:dethiobiotin synthetase
MSATASKGFFVTGTDTGVGKTLVAGAILAALRGRNIDAAPMKPVQTGAASRGGSLLSPDLEFCLDVIRLMPAETTKQHMAPYLFKDACSPHLAAERASRAISMGRLTRSFGALSRLFDAVVVEGAGGLMAPLGRRVFIVDLIKALKLPAVLVARPGLGTLNHTLLSLEALRQRGIPVAAVVLNGGAARPGFIERDNVKTLRRLSGGVPVVEFPQLRAEEQTPDKFRALASRVFGALTRSQ